MVSNIRLSGLATGMDTESLVRDMMKIARMPLDKKLKTKQTLQWKQEDYRTMNLSLLALKNKAFDMRLESSFTARKITSGNQDIVTATATGEAINGTFNLKVAQLAEAASNKTAGAVSANAGNKIDTSASLLSQASKFAEAGSFFEGKTVDDTFTVSVRISDTEVKDFTFSYGNSLKTIIQTINNDKKAGVTLFYDEGAAQDKVVAASKATGKDAVLELNGDFFSVLGLNNANKQDGKNAVFELNGLQTERASNNFTINGVNFSLKGVTAGGFGGAATALTVETDVDTIYNNIKGFVDQYNEIIDLLNKELKEEKFRTYQPLTDEEKAALSESEIEKWEAKARSGLLRSDALLSRAASEIRMTMAQTVKGLSGVNSLPAIGITTANYWEDPNGKLKINEDDLKKAIAADPEGVMKLFNNDSEVANEQGLMRRLYSTVDSAIKNITSEAGSATALYDQSNLSESVRRIDKDIARLEDRLTQIEERYWRQFTAMERAISTMNQQSSWLTAQLSGLTGQQ
ncbi:MAG: flagellar hook-associated protein 2 [Clostridia bacterium]|nr:flagellar hook-associated protein 2 [Clostridia bacterium]